MSIEHVVSANWNAINIVCVTLVWHQLQYFLSLSLPFPFYNILIDSIYHYAPQNFHMLRFASSHAHAQRMSWLRISPEWHWTRWTDTIHCRSELLIFIYTHVTYIIECQWQCLSLSKCRSLMSYNVDWVDGKPGNKKRRSSNIHAGGKWFPTSQIFPRT